MSANKKIIDIEAPVFPESVTDATVIEWYVKEGDIVTLDQKLVDLETDKVVLEVVATAPGRVNSILEPKEAVVREKAVLGKLAVGEETKASTSEAAIETPPEKVVEAAPEKEVEQPKGLARLFRSPSARRSGKAPKTEQAASPAQAIEPIQANTTGQTNTVQANAPATEQVPMTRLRAKIAERLLAAQHEAAILSTFNEVNLQSIIQLRNRYKDQFEKQHGVRLGFMSFFTKAVVEALKQFPKVNASIEGQNIVYHHYYDIGIAVSTERGLVVPVIRNADQLNLSDIEKAINQYGQKARNGSISINELSGGTFTITNGGVFGSLLSTPILNPPQSGILGMHKIEERAIVENGQIVARPMMYLALSYDHRIIDGKESVQFLGTIKNLLEDPTRLLLNI